MKKLAAISALFGAFLLAAAPAAAREDTGVSAIDEIVGLLPSATSESCVHPLIEQPFTFLGDPLDYVLAPDGSFEGEGWILEGGAATAAGNDPFPLRSTGVEDDSVLSMPSGSSATSAPMCVDLNYPHFRMAIRQVGDGDGRWGWSRADGALRVETLYPTANRPRWRRVETIRPRGNGWMISDFLDLEPGRGGEGPGAREVSIRFSASGGEGFEIDDVYVDPRMRR